MPAWDPAEIAAGTADPAFVSDERGVVVGWNEAAEGLLGRSADEVVGSPCHEVLCGLDTFGNRYCDQDCAIMKMAVRSEPARLFVLNVRHESGKQLPLRLSVLRLPSEEPSHFLMVHVLLPAEMRGGVMKRTVGLGADSEVENDEELSEMERIRALTPRETEVLGLLASGNASQDVANELFISLTTVRTHIQNILRKLEVHSQLEAVALAFKRGLI
ncbi:MAG: PAS domain-containing protein [Acidimicrobiia bacterium]|nr:PAS domain-containing protein [Acidimicrobiia bacterium]